MSQFQLGTITKALGADSAAIMAPNKDERHNYCLGSFNMPKEWVDIKNSWDETTEGGNVQVYKTGQPAITNHLGKKLVGHYIESVMILPIKREAKTIAMLEIVHSQKARIFDEDALRKATDFAAMIEPTLPVNV